MKYIRDAIDGDETKIDFIIFPNITRIYASVFLQIFLELYLESKYKNDQQVKIAGFQTLFQFRKQLWIYSQKLMIKILYYNILNENFDELKKSIQQENLNIYFKSCLPEDFNDDDIKSIINNKYDESDDKNYYYCLNNPQRFLNLNKLKEEIKNNKEKYPILSIYFEYSELLEKGKSYLNKLKDVIVINDFENPLLHYYNFIKMQIKQLLKMKLIN